MTRIPTLLAAAGLIAGLSLAPTPTTLAQSSSDFDGDVVEVHEVLLDVLVTDREGNVILGLGAEDFIVEEKGQPVEVASISFYSNRVRLDGEQAGAPTAYPPDNRFFVFLFESQLQVDGQIGSELMRQQLQAARRSQEWIEQEMLPNDWVAIASYDGRLKIQQDFTHNRSLLSNAIGMALKGQDPEGYWPSRIPDGQDGPSLYAGLPKGKELGRQSRKIYDALTLIADATANLSARKNLIFFSRGFGRVNPLGQYEVDRRFYQPMMERLNDSNVAVYALDVSPTASEHTLSDGLNLLADETGGRYFFNFTSFRTPLDQIAKVNNGYYLLSYSSQHRAGSTGFQEVNVRTRNPEFKVSARRGYQYGR